MGFATCSSVRVGEERKKKSNLKHKVADTDWWIRTYSDLLFQVIRLLSQLFHFTHGDVFGPGRYSDGEWMTGKRKNLKRRNKQT